MSEERAWHKDRLAKKLKDAKAAKAFANAFDQIRVFWIVLAEPEHGVVVTKGGAAVHHVINQLNFSRGQIRPR